MAVEINWSPEAQETFSQNITYLQDEWTEKEAANFVQQVNQVIRRLAVFPEAYPQGIKNKKYRKARLNKYIVLFYRYYKTKKAITLITFWNVKQNPANLKY